MGIALWPHHTKKEIEKEFRVLLSSRKYINFLCKNKEGMPVAFINFSIRSDHVQGATSSPVVYVEAVYVKPEYRKQGLAKKLIKIAENWAEENGYRELASDAEAKNIDSQKFHKKLGFKQAGKIVHFIKKIK